MQPIFNPSISFIEEKIIAAKEQWLQEANDETDLEERSLKKQAAFHRIQDLQRKAEQMKKEGFSAEEIAFDIDLFIRACRTTERVFEETNHAFLQRRADEKKERASFGEEFQKSVRSFDVYFQKPRQNEAQRNVLVTMATVHATGETLRLIGETVAMGVRGVCRMTPKTELICQKTGSFVNTVAETKLVKKTIQKLESLDGSFTAKILENVGGFPKTEALQVGQQWSSDLKEIALWAVTAGTAVLVIKGVRYLGREKVASEVMSLSRDSFAGTFGRAPRAPRPKKYPKDFPFTNPLSEGRIFKESRSLAHALGLVKEQEYALRKLSWPVIASLPSDLPKHFAEVCQRALPYQCEGNGIRACLPTVTVNSSEGPCTLYVITNSRPIGVDAGKFPPRTITLTTHGAGGLWKTNTLLDMIFDCSRMEGHSKALLLMSEVKGTPMPILQALEVRAEKIVGKSSFPKEGGHPMSLLEIKLDPGS